MSRVPTGRMKTLARLLKEAGHGGMSLWVAVVLDLHDYQYHGLDPSGELSKYATRKDAVADITSALEELTRRAEVLKGRVKWGYGLENGKVRVSQF